MTDDENTRLRARIEALEGALQEADAFRRSFDGHVYVEDAKYAAIHARLRALEAALREIAYAPEGGVGPTLGESIQIARAALAPQREYDPNVALCDDAEFGMKP